MTASCPRCVGVGGYETAPVDWHDCEVCDATGTVDLLTLFRYQSEKDSEVNMEALAVLRDAGIKLVTIGSEGEEV